MPGLGPVGSYYRCRLIHLDNLVVRISECTHQTDKETVGELFPEVQCHLCTLVLHLSEVLPRSLYETCRERNGGTLHEDVVPSLVKHIYRHVKYTVEESEFKTDIGLVHFLPGEVGYAEIPFCHSDLLIGTFHSPFIHVKGIIVICDCGKICEASSAQGCVTGLSVRCTYFQVAQDTFCPGHERLFGNHPADGC